jgi:hypothetical protein
MTATEVIQQIEALPAGEQSKVCDWLHAHRAQETPEMLAALDDAARSADTRGTTPVADVRQLLPQWISKSA